jgi:predicted TIM-barrel fold metal-dependent hydrolase
LRHDSAGASIIVFSATMLITDAQIHLWEIDRPDRPWIKGLQRPPHRSSGFSAEEILAEMDAVGIHRAIIVPPTWVGDNNQSVLEAAAKYPNRFAVVGRFNPKAPDAHKQLERWMNQAGMLGIRSTFHTKPYMDWLDDGTLDWYWKACAEFGIPIMALVPGMARKLVPVAERHPHLKILIPHMGCALDSRGAAAFASLDDVLSLARYPGISVMVSAAPCYSDQPYPFTDIRPFIRRIFDTYGPRRLLWGSDLSRLKCSYRECLDQFRKSLDFLSAEDKEWMLGKTLSAVLNWPEA